MPKVVVRAGLPALVLLGALLGLTGAAPQGGPNIVTPSTIEKLTAELAGKYGESERPRIERGVKQAGWRRRSTP
jgi:hypothetical protein